ncbi:MAG: hypothetical protein QOG72_185 [Sphingomonadales bacterium]|nr:hypothetical protein [Sphingomonadales bacterium]
MISDHFAAAPAPPKCTLTITKSVTQNSEASLIVVQRSTNFEYKISLPNGEQVSTSCRTYQFREILVTYDSANAIGFHISCRKKAAGNRRLAIWIHGGPWAYASKDLVLEQLAFLDAGYDLFIPLYPGSSDREVTYDGPNMVPDVVDALLELKAALRWGRKRYRLVDVVGESFGAYLAASLAPELDNKGSLFLMSPNLGGQSYLARLYAGKGEELGIAGVRSDAVQVEAKRITAAYFRRLEDYVPLRLLESTKGLKLKLVYGGRDNLLVAEEIRTLEHLAMPGCGVDYRPTDGHLFAYTREQFETFRNMIRCGNREEHRSR